VNARIEQIEMLKNAMVSRATGGSPDDSDYMRLRQGVIGDPAMAQLAPRFLRTCRSLSEFWQFIKFEKPTYAERRQLIWEAFQPLMDYLESNGTSPADRLVSDRVQAFNSEYVNLQWAKALERRSVDPDGAITIARTLLESVCKHILDDAEISYGEGPDLNKLYRLTADHLNLSPSQHTEPVFRQILGGCTAVVEGLGAIRNRHGDAHGSGRLYGRPAPRHAELAVNLAGAVAAYLLATWEARSG